MSVKKNFMYNVIYQILIISIPLITTPYIARVIGAEGVGIQSYTVSIANYFVLFTMLGVSNHGNRTIAMVRDDKEKLSKTFISIVLLKAIIGIVMLFLYYIYIVFDEKGYERIFFIQTIYIVSAIIDINWFFFGIEKFKLTVIRNMIIKLFSIISIFILVKEENDLYLYALILALGNFCGQLILWINVYKYIDRVKVNKEDVIKQLKPMIILFIPVIAVSIYKVMDKIMLGSIYDVVQVGYYENSEKIINIPISIIVALGTVMLPKISNLQSRGDNKKIEKYISLSIDYVMFMSIGATFGIIGISNTLIPIFLGDNFIQSIPIINILSITIIFISWANVIRTQFLIPNKRDKIYITSTLLGAIINFFSNLILIKYYGAIGASIGTILAEAIVAIYQSVKVRNQLKVFVFLKRNIFYIIPGIVMLWVIKIIGNMLPINIITVIIQIIAGSVVYCIISITYMIIIKNEIVLSYLDKFCKAFNR